MKILDKIHSPEDLKILDNNCLKPLAKELREYIVANIHKTGGHLGASLGVVELTIALHRVFNTPEDKIVWDVGHQGYAHKILTGRKENFETNRQYQGISGFINPKESKYDTFGVGHASTSISAGFGFVCSEELKKTNNAVVSVIGDGSISGGLAYEGLNNAGASKKKYLVILNDNKMSISKNVGAMSKYLTSIYTDSTFNKLKDDIWNFTNKVKFGESIRNAASRLENSVKALITPGLLFEKMGFNYIGPVDGHDLDRLIKVLEHIKNDVSGPVLLHVVTQKGKGLELAEQKDTEKCHGVSPGFLAQKPKPKENSLKKYQDVFGDVLCKIAEKNKKITAITAAMKTGTGLADFASKYPDRFFDVGIAEGHAVTFAAGLAINGIKPVVAIYSTFLQRALDNIIHDCALQELDMIFAIDRAGLVGEDGATHHGVFDISFLRYIPNLIFMAPSNEKELALMLNTATLEKGLFALRYPRGTGIGADYNIDLAEKIEIGKSLKKKEGKDLAILAIGDMVNTALLVAEGLAEKNISVSVYDMRFIKPIDKEAIREAYQNHKCLVTLENNAILAGFGSLILESLNEMEIYDAKLKICGIGDHFVGHGKTSLLLKEIRLDKDSLIEDLEDFYSKFKLSKN